MPIKRLQKLRTPVAFSEDAVRYLCNQLFFVACDFLEREKIKIPAGFIHLSMETDLPTAVAANAVGEVMDLVLAMGD